MNLRLILTWLALTASLFAQTPRRPLGVDGNDRINRDVKFGSGKTLTLESGSKLSVDATTANDETMFSLSTSYTSTASAPIAKMQFTDTGWAGNFFEWKHDGGTNVAHLDSNGVFHGHRFIIEGDSDTGLVGVDLNELALMTQNTNRVVVTNTAATLGAGVALAFADTAARTGTLTNLGIVRKYKNADVSTASDTTPNNDADLTFTVGANEVWHFQFWLPMTDGGNGATGGLTGAAGGSDMRWHIRTYTTNVVVKEEQLLGSDTTVDFTLDGTTTVYIEGTVVNGATPGAVTLSWAQTMSGVTATTLKKGASLIATKLN
jgi:hypothetical protein